MQTPLQLDVWLQSYEEFVGAKNNMKQRNLNTVIANILKTIYPTHSSWSCHILSEMNEYIYSSQVLLPLDIQMELSSL